MSPTFRRALAADLSDVLELVTALAADLWPADVVQGRLTELAADVRDALAGGSPDAPRTLILARGRGDRVIACGAARVLPFHPMLRFEPDPRHGYIEYMYVRPAERRRGVARSLLAALEAWLRGQGLSWVTLHRSPTSEAFYAGAGFEPFAELAKRL